MTEFNELVGGIIVPWSKLSFKCLIRFYRWAFYTNKFSSDASPTAMRQRVSESIFGHCRVVRVTMMSKRPLNECGSNFSNLIA